MPCEPWQSAQTAVTFRPDSKSPLPCAVLPYVFSSPAWHEPHVWTWLAEWTGECSSFTGNIACAFVPWHLAQSSGSPRPRSSFAPALACTPFDQSELLVLVANGTSISELTYGDESGMGIRVFRAGGIPSMAIRAADAFLPVNVVLQNLRRNEQLLLFSFPEGRFGVARCAADFVVRNLRAFHRHGGGKASAGGCSVCRSTRPADYSALAKRRLPEESLALAGRTLAGEKCQP